MFELIQEELLSTGVKKEQCISINFENLENVHLCNAIALHDEILKRVKSMKGKEYLFFDEIQEVDYWEKCINSFRVELDCDIAFWRTDYVFSRNICRICDLSIFF